MTDTATTHDHDAERLISRLIFFSDAVFAIVQTLLVLELRPPPGETDAELMAGLERLAPHFLAFAISFALVSVFWVAHLSIMRTLRAFDWRVAVVNLFVLFTIALMPFASALLGEHGGQGLAWRIYCVVLVAASAGQTMLLATIALAPNHFTTREFWYRLFRAMSPGIAFATGFALNFSGYDYLSFYCWALIPVLFLLAWLALGPRRARA